MATRYPTSSAKPADSARGKAPRRLFLIYGNLEAQINEAKLKISHELIPDDDLRRENVTEIPLPTTGLLELRQAIPQIASELGQETLFGDTCRLVIVPQLKELFGDSGGNRSGAAQPKKSKSAKGKEGATPAAVPINPVEMLFKRVDSLLSSTPNALMFIAVEDEGKMRRVDEKGALFQELSRRSHVQKFASKARRFELTDALMSRSLPAAIEVVTAWRKDDRQSAAAIYRALLDDVQLLVQAAIQGRESARLRENPQFADLLFPPGLRPNLMTIHEFRQKKYLGAIHNYPSMEHLLEGLRGLLEIQNALYPTGEELYIPSVDYLIDLWLVRFLGR